MQAILRKAKYTGRQVWNRQPAHDTSAHLPGPFRTQHWIGTRQWVVSTNVAHPALVSEADFVAVHRRKPAASRSANIDYPRHHRLCAIAELLTDPRGARHAGCAGRPNKSDRLLSWNRWCTVRLNTSRLKLQPTSSPQLFAVTIAPRAAHDDGLPLHEASAGGGCDGLTASGRNENQGVAATLALLSALQHAQRLDCAGDPVFAGHQFGLSRRPSSCPAFDR